jgi:hypothetical protein
MELLNARDYVGGWFIGAFEPSMWKTDEFEVCIKRYLRGQVEPRHYQLLATEFTLVVSGQCRVGPHLLGPDDVLRIDPLEVADFEAITDVVLVAVKTPSLATDKRLGELDGHS